GAGGQPRLLVVPVEREQPERSPLLDAPRQLAPVAGRGPARHGGGPLSLSHGGSGGGHGARDLARRRPRSGDARGAGRARSSRRRADRPAAGPVPGTGVRGPAGGGRRGMTRPRAWIALIAAAASLGAGALARAGAPGAPAPAARADAAESIPASRRTAIVTAAQRVSPAVV